MRAPTTELACLDDFVRAYEAALGYAKLREQFGPRVAELVGWLTEVKRDEAGQERPWATRKDEHHALADARWNKRTWEFLRDYANHPTYITPLNY